MPWGRGGDGCSPDTHLLSLSPSPSHVDHAVLVPGVAEVAFPRLLHRWWSPRVTVPACIFGGELDRVRSPLPTPNSMEKTGGENDKRQTGKNKPFPTKMTTDGSFGSLWHLLLMDGCLQPFCALRTLPSPTDQAWPGTCAQHQQMGGMDGVGHPARPPLPRPLLPATSASLGDLRPPPPTVFAKDRRLEVDLPHSGRKRRVGAAQCWPCWGQTCHTGTLGPQGGSCVQPPSRPSGPFPCGPHLEGHISLCNLPPPRHERPRSSRPSLQPPLAHGKYSAL